MVLQIAILGSLEAHVNGALVCVPAGKQRALLTLLTVRAPHPVSAESVAEALWPRAAPAEAMRRLRVTASRRGARSVTPVRYWRRWRRDIGWR
jgi:DNA-binding SARP family transcriptional activator